MTSAMPVQCSTNWAIKPTGSWSYCEFVIYSWRMNKWIWIYGTYIELQMKDLTEERSSQLVHNSSSCEKKTWKKFRLERDSNPWRLWCRCSALPTELSSQLNKRIWIYGTYIELRMKDLTEERSSLVQAWIFFRLSFRNCLSCVLTARIFLLL